MDGQRTRRNFLKLTAGTLAGVGLSPVLAPLAGSAAEASGIIGGRVDGAVSGGESRALVGSDGLPPRTVGLRSLGGDFAFDPAGLVLAPGSELTWLNMGDFHTTTAFHPDNADLLPDGAPLRIPEDAEPWHSGMLGLDAGTEFTHTFRVPGVYDYFCQPHYSFGMVGRIVVTSSVDDVPRPRSASQLNEASREEIPRVRTILGPPGRAFEWTARINGILLLRVHEEATEGPGSRLARAMADDTALEGLLERAGLLERTRDAVARFVEAVRGTAGYETLVALADEAKAPLTEAVDAGV